MRHVFGHLLPFMVIVALVGAGQSPTGKGTIIGDQVHLRVGPGENRSLVTTLTRDQPVVVTGRAVGWYRVEAGRIGWVAEDYLRLSLEGRIAEDGLLAGLLGTAQSLLGCPYVYGRAGPHGFDCSGLTSYVFARNGVKLPRESDGQIRAGIRVARDDLRPGDLVFFTTNGQGTISHAGIYLFDGEFIHASSSRGRVTTSTMNLGYYAQRFMGAARVIDRDNGVGYYLNLPQ